MRNFLVAGWLAVAAAVSAAQAEPIAVRSGEHETFTRLVMPIPEGAKWVLERRLRTSFLAFSDHDDGFDLSLAFDVIPRTRLAALLARDSELELQLSCDCLVTAFVEQGRFLVVDIADTLDPAATSDPGTASSAMPASPFSYGELLWRQNEDPSPVRQGDIGRQLEPMDSPPDSASRARQETEVLLETQTDLLKALANAASRGVVDPVLPVNDVAEEPVQVSESAIIFDSSDRAPIEIATTPTNVRVTSSSDIPQASALGNLAVSGVTCADPEIVSIGTWGTEMPFGHQISRLQSELYDDVDHASRTNILALAKLYLFFGFGAEARQTLGLDETLAEKHPELIDLSYIFDFGQAFNPRILHRYPDCDSDLALWGILAAEEIPAATAINANAALRGLQNLPSHLKYALAPELSRRLFARGETEAANVALRSYENLEQSENSPPNLAQAARRTASGEEDAAKDILEEIVSESTPDAPSAVIALVEKSVAENTPLPADVALLAESYATELRNAPNRAEMFRAFVQASIKSGQYDKAFDALQSVESSGPEQSWDTLYDLLFSEITAQADDAAFLESYFEDYGEFQLRLSSGVRLGIAQRLLDIGFFEETLSLANELSGLDDKAEVRLLQAKAALRLDSFEHSLALIEDLDSEEADRIRAEALERTGRNEDAALLFSKLNQPRRSSESQWLATNWSELLDDDSPVFGSFLDVRNDVVTSIPNGDQMLGHAADAIDASASVRARLEAALSQLEISENQQIQ